MRSRSSVVVSSIAFLLLGWLALGGFGQQEQPPRFDLLVVDETRTFGSSIRVEVLARAVNRTGLFELSARIVQVDSSFADPLQGEQPDKRYDIILLIPRGIDEGTLKQIWVITRPFTKISEELRETVAQLKGIADKIFQGVAETVDVTEDLIPGFFATIFIREGWL